MDAKAINRETRRDPMLARVLEYTLSGWPNYITDKELKPYFTSRNGLTAEQDCVLWGMQVIFLSYLRNDCCKSYIKSTDPGIVAMKAIARSYIWWPNLTEETELMVQSCDGCQAVQAAAAPAPLYPCRLPTGVWQWVLIEFENIAAKQESIPLPQNEPLLQ